MTKSHSSPRRHRAAGPPARRVSLRGRYAWSFVIGWATFPFLPAQGNAQGRCDTPSCDCRTGQVTPCDAVGAMGSRAFDSLMLPSLAEATLRNTDRLGNSIESKTLKWIERSKQLSARWRFADSSCDSCDAGGQGSRACGSEHPPIVNQPTNEISAEQSGPLHSPEWTELPMAPSGTVATPPTPYPSDSPVWMHQSLGTPEIPQPNKQDPLIDPFIDDPQQPATIIPSVEGKPLGQMLRQRRNEAATRSAAIDVPPVWIASRPAAGKRATTEIDPLHEPSADLDPSPSGSIRQASDSQPIRDPAATTGSKAQAQPPRTKKRPKPFESSQRGPLPAQAALPAPPDATPLPPDAKPLPTPAMQSYEEFARRLQASRSIESRADDSASHPLPESFSTVSPNLSEGQNDSTLEQATVAPEPPSLNSELSAEVEETSAPPERPVAEVDPAELGELPAIAEEQASKSTTSESTVLEGSQLPADDTAGSVEANESSEKETSRTDSVPSSEDAEAILDARITHRILNQLKIAKDQGALKQFELDVSTVGGEVWVRGFVSRQEHKKLILDTIQQVPGVVVVIDDVSIARPMPAPRTQQPSEEALDAENENAEKLNPRLSKSADAVAEPQRGLSLPKWLRPKTAGTTKENTDFRSTVQSPSTPRGSLESTAKAPRGRTRGAFGASTGPERTAGAAPLSSPVVPVKPTPPVAMDKGSAGPSPTAGPTDELQRRTAPAAGIPDGRADIDRRTKAKLAATATRIDQPQAGSTVPSKLPESQPPVASGEATTAVTSQGTTEATKEQGLDLNSFLQRVNAAKQAKDHPK